MNASRQSVFRSTFWGAAALLVLSVRLARAASLVIYDDSLENNFLDYSYGGTVNFAATTPVHSGTHSISFTSAGNDAVKVAISTRLDTATYPQLVFWFYGTAAQCSALNINLEIDAGANDSPVASGPVSGYTDCNSGAGAWKQITVDLTAAPISASGQFDRISLFDSTNGGFGTVYFDDVSLQSAVVDEIFANGFEGGVVAPPPVNGLVDEPSVFVDHFTSDRFTWYDASNQPRVAVLAHNDAQTYAGTHGGDLREFVYQVSGAPRSVAAPARNDGGFGYIVSHPGDESFCVGGDSSVFGNNIAGTWTRVFVGRHHAIFRFQQNYPRLCSSVGPAMTRNIPVSIDWVFSTGRDNPLWSVTYDMSAIGANVLRDDSRAPYGDLNIDGSTGQYMDNDVAGIRWGDRYQFVTSGAATLASAWNYTTANTIPFTELWTTGVDATMGLVQTQTMSRQDAGGGRLPYGPGTYDVSAYWTKTSTAGIACPDGSEDGQTGTSHSLPCVQYWPYQMNSFSYGYDMGTPVTTNDAKMTWGTQYGFLGQSAYDLYDRTLPANSTASGYPQKSYSVFVVLGTHSSAPVDAEVARSLALSNTTLTATTGSVATTGPAGVNRTDTLTYQPAGYDPIYSALVFNASGNAVTGTLSVSSGTLKNPMIVVRGYTAGAYPATVKFNGATLTMDSDYFPSLRTDKSELWITLNRNVTGNGNTFQITP